MGASSVWSGVLNSLGGSGSSGPYETITWTEIPALFTDPDPNVADREIYVSSSLGNDSYDGTSGTWLGLLVGPKRTLNGGLALVRNGHGDRLWLRKGDEFDDQNFTNFSASGASTGRPVIVGSYGSGARPVVKPHSSQSFTNSGALSHIWIMGIKMRSSTYDGTGSVVNAVHFSTSASDILIEDCEISNAGVGIFLGGTNRHSDIRVRGCLIADCYTTGTDDTHGFLSGATDGLTIEYTTFSDCGWKASVSGSTATVRRHAIYVQGGTTTAGGSGCTDVELKNNIILDTDGLQLRSGGICTGNVVSRVKVGITIGTGVNMQQPSGCGFTCEDNVVLEPQVFAALPTISYVLGGVGIASSFARNVAGRTISSDPNNDNVNCIWFTTPGDATLFSSATISFTDNIIFHAGYWNWASGITYATGCLNFTGNDFQLDPLYDLDHNLPYDRDAHCFRCNPSGVLANQVANGNNYWSSVPETGDSSYWGYIAGNSTPIADWVGASNLDDATATFTDHTSGFYTDPERTLGKYYVSIGHTTLGSETLNHAGLRDLLRAQYKDSWDDELTAPAIVAYIQEGFDI